MRRKNPTVLPGKELSSRHLSVKHANLCTEEQIQEEVLGLLTLAAERLWIKKDQITPLLEAACKKDPKKLWDISQDWHRKINSRSPEESKALAGWLLLRNITACQNIRLAHKPPYNHLLNPNDQPLQTLVKLNHFLYYNSQGNSKEKETAQRDLLAILILKHVSLKEQEELCLRIHGKKAYENSTFPNWIKISHGFFDKNKQWHEPQKEKVQKLLENLLPKEPEKNKAWIKTLNIL